MDVLISKRRGRGFKASFEEPSSFPTVQSSKRRNGPQKPALSHGIYLCFYLLIIGFLCLIINLNGRLETVQKIDTKYCP